MSSRDFGGLDHHSSSATRTIGSEHYHALMKKEHPDWNFCPTCNSSLAIEIRSDVLGLLLTNPENRFIISASLSTEVGTGILSPFSLNGDTKIPVWAEATQLGSPGLTKERLFEEVIVQHVLPAFRNGFKLAKYSGPEEDIHLFLQVLIKYAQKDLSDRALNLDKSFAEQQTPSSVLKELSVSGPTWSANLPANGSQNIDTPKSTLTSHYSPEDDPNRKVLLSETQVSSGVLGLDKILGGGLPKGKVTLVSGPSGSGKTLLASQFLLDGAKRGENSVFVLAGHMPHEVLEQLEHLGLALTSQIRTKRVVLVVKDQKKVYKINGLDIINVRNRNELFNVLGKLIRKRKFTRLAIDSFTALFENANRKELSPEISHAFERLTDLRCTTLLTGDLPAGSSKQLSYFGIEDRFATGIIILGSKSIAEKHTRYLYIPKLKGSNHSLSKYVFSVEESAGIKVIEPLRNYAESLRPKHAIAPTQSSFPGWPEMANMLKFLSSMNGGLPQSPYGSIANLEGSGAQEARPVYSWQSADSYLSNNGQRSKVPQIKARTSSNQPRQLSIEEAKLTSAAAENPWVSIISARDEVQESPIDQAVQGQSPGNISQSAAEAAKPEEAQVEEKLPPPSDKKAADVKP